MKLTQSHMNIINQYVDEVLIDKERLITYMEKHKIIKNDVFRYCSRHDKDYRNLDFGYCMCCSSNEGYNPVDRETFIRRIPFYFYLLKVKDRIIYSHSLYSILRSYDTSGKKIPTSEELENIYAELEFIHYNLHLSCEEMFSYLPMQLIGPRKESTPPTNESGDEKSEPHSRWSLSRLFSAIAFDHFDHVEGFSVRDIFPKWCHYLHLCLDLGWSDYMPDRLLTQYNLALEASGLTPIIYDPLAKYHQYFFRDGNCYTCQGHFPMDENGMPIFRWTSIRIHNPKSIHYDAAKSSCGELRIELNPDTTIHALNIYEYMSDEEETVDSTEESWNQIYAGPLTMSFNHEALKEYRLYREMTQKELADAVGASVRTYQKWESGETVPDGHNLLRLMNWLEITDVQLLITYTQPND